MAWPHRGTRVHRQLTNNLGQSGRPHGLAPGSHLISCLAEPLESVTDSYRRADWWRKELVQIAVVIKPNGTRHVASYGDDEQTPACLRNTIVIRREDTIAYKVEALSSFASKTQVIECGLQKRTICRG